MTQAINIIKQEHRNYLALLSCLQHLVADLAAVPIVEPLEVVDIGKTEAEVGFGVVSGSDVDLQSLFEVPPVDDLGQWVDRRLLAQVDEARVQLLDLLAGLSEPVFQLRDGLLHPLGGGNNGTDGGPQVRLI